jgi:hypothetical protein
VQRRILWAIVLVSEASGLHSIAAASQRCVLWYLAILPVVQYTEGLPMRRSTLL